MTNHSSPSQGGSAAEDELQRVFISYRRSDCQPQANGLHDGLGHRMKSTKIFMDIDSIPPGVDFEDHIRREIELCDVVLVLIGDNWLDPRPGTDVRRIDEPDDFVRLEIESALSSSRRLRLIPVLVEGAVMPRADELPESIRRLARINAIELSDSRWTSDVGRLAQILESIANERVSEAEPQRTVRLADIDAEAVTQAVASMPPEFRTKDVSQHPEMRNAHADVFGLSNYHTMVGRYLSSNRTALALQAPSAAVDDRGAIWRKEPRDTAVQPGSPPVQGGQVVAPQASPYVPQYVPRPAAHSDRTPTVGWVMIALPILSCGLASVVPPIWVATKRPHDRAFRQRMFALAASLGALMVLGFVLVGTAPTDASGTATGAASDVGVVMFLASMVAGTVVAVLYRKPRTRLPGTEQELARRHQREQYRALIKNDPSLARNINVGRPALQRNYADGGLLDLNHVTIDELARFGAVPTDEARRIVETRERLGRLSGLDELVAYVALSESTVSRLRETAVFL